MKILICGGGGLLGREICNKLEELNINYISTYFNNIINKKNFYKFNLDTIEDIINFEKPSIIINCIVNRLVDECENNWNEIKKVNIDITEKLAKLGIKIIHISTDYVFDGKNPPYYDNSLTNPIQNYGISKLISELRIINNSSNYLIIRVPVLFTDKYKNLNENAVTSIGKNLMNLTIKRGIILEDAISIRRPVYIPILVNFIIDAIISNYKGIYHFYNPIDKYTKYEILNIISSIIKKPISNIIPSYKISNRPIDTALSDNKYNINKYYDNYNFYTLMEKCFNKFYHPKDLKDCFLMIDLDGTLVDSEYIHFKSYNEIIGLSIEEFKYKNQYNLLDYSDEIKTKKNLILKDKIKELKLIDGAELFLRYLLNNNINFCIITNTSKNNVELYKNEISILKEIKNWITREDYIHKKPNKECYELAINKYYKNEKFKIGIENTIAGYEALKNITDIIYIKIDNNEDLFKNNDVYLIDNLEQIL